MVGVMMNRVTDVIVNGITDGIVDEMVNNMWTTVPWGHI
jgi:hypothetical protein